MWNGRRYHHGALRKLQLRANVGDEFVEASHFWSQLSSHCHGIVSCDHLPRRRTSVGATSGVSFRPIVTVSLAVTICQGGPNSARWSSAVGVRTRTKLRGWTCNWPWPGCTSDPGDDSAGSRRPLRFGAETAQPAESQGSPCLGTHMAAMSGGVAAALSDARALAEVRFVCAPRSRGIVVS